MNFTFTMAQISPVNLCLAMNADPATQIVTTTNSTTFKWPKAGGVNRASIVWVSDDGFEVLCLAKGFASGDISIARRKGTDVAGVGVTFSIEENSDETVLDGEDAIMIFDHDLVA